MGFLSQSGALGLAIIDYANALGLGLSSFVSVGNKADISGNDLLSYWEQDDRTGLVLLYLESFGNPRKFARIARRVARTKPVLAVKSGRSAAGARATSSHTGALLAASDVTVDALFHQAGVIRTDSLAELFDVASLLATSRPGRPARGDRGQRRRAGDHVRDACEAGGLEVVQFSGGSRPAWPRACPRRRRWPTRSTCWPRPHPSTTAGRSSWWPRRGGRRRHRHLHPAPTWQRSTGRPRRGRDGRVGPGAERRDVGRRAAAEDGDGPRLPRYRFPEDAARALVRAVEYATWRQSAARCPSCHVRHDEAAALLAAALADGPGAAWLARTRLPGCSPATACLSPSGAWLALPRRPAGRAELGGPVALKAVAPRLVHKTEAHAVRLGLAGAEQVQTAAAEMAEAVAAEHGGRVLVQRMVGGGWSCWSVSSTTPRSVR